VTATRTGLCPTCSRTGRVDPATRIVEWDAGNRAGHTRQIMKTRPAAAGGSRRWDPLICVGASCATENVLELTCGAGRSGAATRCGHAGPLRASRLDGGAR